MVDPKKYLLVWSLSWHKPATRKIEVQLQYHLSVFTVNCPRQLMTFFWIKSQASLWTPLFASFVIIFQRGLGRRDSRTVLQSQIGSTGLTSNSLVRSRSSWEKKGFGDSSSENNLTSSAGRLEPDSHPIVTVSTSSWPWDQLWPPLIVRTFSTWSVRLLAQFKVQHTLSDAHTQICTETACSHINKQYDSQTEARAHTHTYTYTATMWEVAR